MDPVTPDENPKPTSSSVAPVGRLGFRGRHATPKERAKAFDGLFFEGPRRRPYLLQFFVLMLLSALIAGFGLANDSAAVVIGAMLIAPLMTPILASAAAIVTGRPRRFGQAFTTVLAGALTAIAVGIVVALVDAALRGGAPLPSELLARTGPNLRDLGIALAAGAAGGFVTIRSESSAALPGVGIAVALVPPLAAIGMTLAVGEWGLAAGATLLFATNLFAIVLAAGIVFVLGGYEAYWGRLGQARARGAWTLLVVAVLVVAIPLGWHSFREIRRIDAVSVATRTVADWAPGLTLIRIEVDTFADPTMVAVGLTGQESPPDVDRLAGMLAERLDSAVSVELAYVPLTMGEAPAP